MSRFSLKWLFVGVGVVALAISTVLQDHQWWVAALATTKAFCITFAAIYAIARRSLFAAGFSVTGVIAMLNRTLNLELLERLLVDLFMTPYEELKSAEEIRYWFHVQSVVDELTVLAFCVIGGAIAVYLGRGKGGPVHEP